MELTSSEIRMILEIKEKAEMQLRHIKKLTDRINARINADKVYGRFFPRTEILKTRNAKTMLRAYKVDFVTKVDCSGCVFYFNSGELGKLPSEEVDYYTEITDKEEYPLYKTVQERQIIK